MDEIYKKYGFPSFQKFKSILTMLGIKKTSKEINEFLQNQKVHQLHKTTLDKREMQKFITALKPFQIVQIDLIDYSKFSRQNKGNHFILVGVDVFSRKAFASFIKNKTPSSVLNGFKNWNLSEATFGLKPHIVYHDLGNEFKGVFNTYCNNQNILNLNCNLGNHKALGVIDRFCKTIKTILSKYMTNNNTTQIYNVLDEFVNAYNHTPHSSLFNYSPEDVLTNQKAFLDVLQLNQEKLMFNNQIDNKINLKVGDYVRVKLKKNQFEKGYTINYSKRVYQIERLSSNKAILNNGNEYNVKDLQVVNNNENVDMDNIERIENENRINRRMIREGIEPLEETEELYWTEPQ